MDTGLHSLIAIARIHQIPADAEQIAHQFGGPGRLFSDTDLLLVAKALGLRAKCIFTNLSQLRNETLPAIAKSIDGTYFIIARVGEKTGTHNPCPTRIFLTHDLRDSAPRSVSKHELEEKWSGELIMISRRQSLSNGLQNKFDISWFIPSLVKYRKLFGEVLIASFLLQFFALITPLFFQVVMDKVLVHRGFTTLARIFHKDPHLPPRRHKIAILNGCR